MAIPIAGEENCDNQTSHGFLQNHGQAKKPLRSQTSSDSHDAKQSNHNDTIHDHNLP